MTSGTSDDDALAGVLIQLAAHAEQIADLDTRVTSHHQDAAQQLAVMSEQADGISSRVEAITTILGSHASVVNALGGLDQQVAALARDIAQLTANSDAHALDYQPEPAPPWWHLAANERDAAIDRLRAWIEQIYRPSYGHLAAELSPCWEHHPLCLFTLDWLSELWSVLYLRPHRSASTLSAQAEWQTRLLPAAAAQMTRESAHCEHGSSGFRRPPAQRPLPRHDNRE